MPTPYAEVSDVQARNPYRAVTESTKPGTAEVQAWLLEADAMLNGALLAAGIAAPVANASGKLICKSWVTDYVSALVRIAYAVAGGDGSNGDGTEAVQRWEDRLKDIEKRPAIYSAMLNQGDADATATRIRAYTTHNDDDLTIEDGDFAPVITGAEQF